MAGKERPILFSSPMIKAILEGRKTQTRRIANSKSRCRYGVASDFLWVRETWARTASGLGGEYTIYAADYSEAERKKIQWKPSIFMPRKESRICLKVLNIRLEHLWAITEEDAIAEGIVELEADTFLIDTPSAKRQTRYLSAIEAFKVLWDSINGDRPGACWAGNPLVWAIDFEVKNE